MLVCIISVHCFYTRIPKEISFLLPLSHPHRNVWNQYLVFSYSAVKGLVYVYASVFSVMTRLQTGGLRNCVSVPGRAK
jgi:hypothetical protein